MESIFAFAPPPGKGGEPFSGKGCKPSPPGRGGKPVLAKLAACKKPEVGTLSGSRPIKHQPRRSPQSLVAQLAKPVCSEEPIAKADARATTAESDGVRLLDGQ